jgi:hypothetical protein
VLRRAIPVDAQRLLRIAEGLAGETFDRALAVSSNAPASGALRVAGMALTQGQVVTNLSCYVTTGQAGLTDAWLAVFAADGTLMAQTATSPGAFGATGIVTLPLTVPWTVPATGMYYVGLLVVTAGAVPTFGGASPAATGIGNAIGTGRIRGGGQAGLAALPNPAVVAAGGLNWLPWMAAS